MGAIQCPVDTVSWDQATEYCNKLSEDVGLALCYSCSGSGATVSGSAATPYSGEQIYDCPGYRLPTEAEWENAYRAGSSTDISKIRHSQSILTQDHTLMGSPLYMSPEQGEGNAKDVDHHSDIFSLGSICYEALYGEAPFNAPTVSGIIYQIRFGEPKPRENAASLLRRRALSIGDPRPGADLRLHPGGRGGDDSAATGLEALRQVVAAADQTAGHRR